MRKSDISLQVFQRLRSRIFREQDEWFYHTREGIRGGFASKKAAEADLRLFVGTMEFVESNGSSLPADIDGAHVETVHVREPDWR